MNPVEKMQVKVHAIYKEALMNPATVLMLEDLEKVFGYNGPSVSDKGNPSATQALYRGATRDVLNRIRNYSNPKFFDKYKDITELQTKQKENNT